MLHRSAALGFLVGVLSCGGATVADAPTSTEPTPPAQQGDVVLQGRLKGETADCGIGGLASCFGDRLDLEVWLLPESAADLCGQSYPYWCSPDERTALVRTVAAADGRFELSAPERDYRLVVVYRNTLRPLSSDEDYRTGERGTAYHLVPGLFPPDEIFHFMGEDQGCSCSGCCAPPPSENDAGK